MAFRIRYINDGYESGDTFDSVADAVAHGKRHGFEFAVRDDETNRVAAAWGPITGLRYPQHIPTSWFDRGEREGCA